MSARSVPSYSGTDRRSALAARWAAGARVRRHERFFGLTGATPASRIVDLGCGSAGLAALEPGLDIVGVDLERKPGYERPLVVADLSGPLPFADGEFDLAYSNSLIEHLPPSARATFAAEVQRVARGHYVQTPALSFPVEPHALLPGVHWLPRPLRRAVWGLGVGGEVDATWLLPKRELARLFDGEIHAERFAGLVKSWVCIRPVGR